MARIVQHAPLRCERCRKSLAAPDVWEIVQEDGADMRWCEGCTRQWVEGFFGPVLTNVAMSLWRRKPTT